MGQTQSVIPEKEGLQQLRRAAEEGGPAAVSKYIDETINKWRDEDVAFAITGQSAVGKSSFINHIRDVTHNDSDFAKQGSGDTTTEPKSYRHPKNEKIVFWDLPGFATLKVTKADYVQNMRLHEYDLFLIFFEHVLTENDLWMAEQLLDLKKPFCFVRSKIDINIENAANDGKSPEDVLNEIRSKAEATIHHNTKLKECKALFLISNRKEDIGDKQKLINFIEDHLPSRKFECVVYALSTMSNDIIQKKYQQLHKRLWLITAACASVAAIPIPGIDVAVNIAVFVAEIKHYIDVFGLNRDKIQNLQGLDYRELKCRELLMPGADLTKLILQTIGKAVAYGAILATESVVDIVLPVVGSVISATTTAVIVFRTLKQFLDDFKADAEIIYKHIVTERERVLKDEKKY